MNTIYKSCAAVCGAVVSFVTGIPAILWVLLGAMSIDFFTGLVCGAAGVSDKSPKGHLSSTAARTGVLRKVMTLLVVLLASLLEAAYAHREDAMAEDAAEMISEIRFYLHGSGVELADYAPEHASWFELLPAPQTATLRPALIQDGRVIRKGLASAGGR